MKLRNKVFLVLVPLLLTIALAGCAPRLVAPDGWPGAAVLDNTLLIGTRQGRLVSLDRNTGETLWRFELRGNEAERAIYGKPVISGDTIYLGGYDGILYALSLDGDLIWQERLGGPIVGSPVVVGDTILVGSSDGNMYAISTQDHTTLWRFQTGNKVWTTPAVSDGTIYFGSLDHNLYAVRLEDGSEVWQFHTNGGISAAPILVNGRVYVGSFNRVFYALDAATGQVVWQFDGAQGWYWGDPVATADTIFVPSLDGKLYALDIAAGQLRWTLSTNGPIVGSPAIVNGLVAVASEDGRVRLARIQDGRELDACNISERIRTSLLSAGDSVYFGAQDSSIRALRIKTNGNPDELWVHFTDRDDPLPRGRAPAC